MYSSSDLKRKAETSAANTGLQSRAFDRLIASQLKHIKKNAPSKAVPTEEEHKLAQEMEREKNLKKSKKMSARALELSKQGLSGAVIQMMLKEEGELDSGSDEDGSSSDDSRAKKKRKKSKKEKKSKKSKKSKKEKKRSKKSKKEKKRKRESSESSDESGSESDSEPEAAPAEAPPPESSSD
ncbi:hypothetical protein TeGR_g7972 [Tetraparma gracilis]|uniref:Uncharacterized protein n=1 Tax=Tetraparma gracilis TaxID=2962635 RepID=A0ABQ6M6N9_9STRA|nr:hypothetical protein TeGR_g7972 [Tetraparma gracilis]